MLEGLGDFILHLNVLNAECGLPIQGQEGTTQAALLLREKGRKCSHCERELRQWEGSPCCWCSETLHRELKHWLCTKQALDCESCKEAESSWGKEGKTFIYLAVVVPFSFSQHMISRYNSKCSRAATKLDELM